MYYILVASLSFLFAQFRFSSLYITARCQILKAFIFNFGSEFFYPKNQHGAVRLYLDFKEQTLYWYEFKRYRKVETMHILHVSMETNWHL